MRAARNQVGQTLALSFIEYGVNSCERPHDGAPQFVEPVVLASEPLAHAVFVEVRAAHSFSDFRTRVSEVIAHSASAAEEFVERALDFFFLPRGRVEFLEQAANETSHSETRTRSAPAVATGAAAVPPAEHLNETEQTSSTDEKSQHIETSW
jgi:hypothetical protein